MRILDSLADSYSFFVLLAIGLGILFAALAISLWFELVPLGLFVFAALLYDRSTDAYPFK